MILTTLPSGKTIATIEGDTHIGRWAIESGRLDHDQNMLPLLRPFIPKGGTVIDVGAYIGDHTVFYAECVGDSGNVYALEPNEEAFKCLAYNMMKSPQVRVLKAGASDRHHTIGLAISDNGGAAYATDGGEISCIQMDSLTLDRCDFIKLDCEGMEPLALKGAERTITKFLPTMLIEVNAGALLRQGFSPSHIFYLLDGWGYGYRNIYANQPTKGSQYDIICTHPAQ